MHSPYASSTYRSYVLGLLTIVYAFNFIDRQLLAILQEPIRQEFGLADWQLGLLTGFAFAIFYTAFGIPIARWADKSVRRNIIAVALIVWSVMTALTSVAQSYAHLVMARIGVAVGEAGGSPPAHSMISDMYPPERRGTAIATYSTGVGFGILFGVLAGGWINEFFGWRVAFLVVGGPGIALALLLRYTVHEPPRGFAEKVERVADPPSFGETARLLLSKRTFRHVAMGTGLVAFVGYGTLNWSPPYFMRTFELGTGAVGTWLGPILGLSVVTGTFLGGFVADRLGERDQRWYVWIPAMGAILMVPAFMIMFLSTTVSAALIAFIAPSILLNTFLAPSIAIAHSLVGLRMRALASAVLFFVLNLIGLGGGPFVIGALSSALEPTYGSDSLRFALIATILVAGPWGALHYVLAGRSLRADVNSVSD